MTAVHCSIPIQRGVRWHKHLARHHAYYGIHPFLNAARIFRLNRSSANWAGQSYTRHFNVVACYVRIKPAYVCRTIIVRGELKILTETKQWDLGHLCVALCRPSLCGPSCNRNQHGNRNRNSNRMRFGLPENTTPRRSGSRTTPTAAGMTMPADRADGSSQARQTVRRRGPRTAPPAAQLQQFL